MKPAVLVCSIAMLGMAVTHAQQPAAADGWVVLSLEDYRALRARAFPSPPDLPSPPVDVALTRVDYDLRAAGSNATGLARLTIDVLKQGWITVPVPAGILVRHAQIDGQPTALVDDKPPRVVIARPGRTVLTLDVVVPIVSSAGSQTISLPAPGSAIAAISLAVPRGDVELAAGGATVVERSSTSSETRWVLYAPPEEPLVLTWKRLADDRRATLPLRLRAHVAQLVGLGEDSTSLMANVRTDVVQGVAREIVLTAPNGLLVTQVTGPMVAGWSHEQGLVRVALLDSTASETSVVISGEIRAPREGAIDIPLIRMPSAERETGGVAVDVQGSGEISDRTTTGLVPADPSELGEIVGGRESLSMAAFRFRPATGASPRSLAVVVLRYAPQAVLVANVEEARYDAAIGEDGRMLVRARYAVRNNQRNFLGLTLPADAAIWTADVAGRPVRPGVASGGTLLVPLLRGHPGREAPAFAVEVIYLQRTDGWSRSGAAQIQLAAVDLPVSRSTLSLQHSPRFRVRPSEGLFRTEPEAPPWSAVLRGDLAVAAIAPNPSPTPSLGALPLPPFGPSLFFVAELIPEGRTPTIEITYTRHKG